MQGESGRGDGTGGAGSSERNKGFSEALVRAAESLRQTALRAVRDPDDAADLLQDTLLSALAAEERFDDAREILPWLRGMMRNHLHVRRRQAHRTKSMSLDHASVSPTVDPARIKEAEVHLGRALRKLPAESVRLLDLRLRDGLTSTEIGAELGISASAVRTRLQRTIRQLRDLMPGDVELLVMASLAITSGATAASPLAVASDRTSANASPSWTRPNAAWRWPLAAGGVLGLIGAWWFASIPATSPPTTPLSPRLEATATAQSTAEPISEPRAVARLEVHASRPRTGNVTVLGRWANSDEPASGVTVRLVAPHVSERAAARLAMHWQQATFDERGAAVFHDVPYGPARLLLDDGIGTADQWVLDSDAQTRLLVLRPVTRVTGRVLDPDRNPIADAKIWISSTGGRWTPGYIATRSSETGSFEVAVFETGWSIWATADGWRTPQQVNAFDAEASDSVDLVLLRRPATLTGRLVDARGHGIGNAAVCVRNPNLAQVLHAISDDTGRFELSGLTGGKHVVAAAATDHAPMWDTVDVPSGGSAAVTLRLSRGATIRGSLLEADDLPTDNLRVMVYQRQALKLRLGLLIAVAPVQPDFSYRVHPAPTGQLAVRVQQPGAADTAAMEEVLAQDGQTVLCHPTFEDAKHLTGRVVDAKAAPVPDVRVVVRDRRFDPLDGDDLSATGFTDVTGRFRITVTSAGPFNCYVFSTLEGNAGLLPMASIKDVAAEDAPTIRLTPGAEPTAYIVGRAVGHAAGARPRARAELTTRDQSWRITTLADPKTGRFELGPIPPATYQVRVRDYNADDLERHRFASDLVTIPLRASERHDLGDVPLRAHGELRLRVSRPGDLACRTPVRLERTQHWIEPGVPFEISMPVGNHLLNYLDGDCRDRVRSFWIDSGKVTEVSLQLRSARRCHLVFPFERRPRTAVEPGPLNIELADSQDNVWSWHILAPSKNGYTLDVPLGPGSYSVRARTIRGSAGDGTLDMRESGPAQTVEVPLR